MPRKVRVGILFGGRSAEHEVSLQSAKNIVEAIDRDRYEVFLIGIDKQGRWHLNEPSRFLLHADDPKRISLPQGGEQVALKPWQSEQHLIRLSHERSGGPVDVVFPVLHGPYGEDGTVQGLLKLANIPFVGAGVLGSAVGMDKDVMKRLFREADLPTPRFLVFHRSSRETIDFGHVRNHLGLPLFVKPANLGSSVGIHKVDSPERFVAALEDAFRYDHKILVEEAIQGREIECSVLGNDNPIASVPGEVLPHHPFYSYKAKYIDEEGATLEIPAKLPGPLAEEIQSLAVQAFRVLCCEGMARVDFFLDQDNRVLINEINTIPGFTNISMYTKLWEASGLPQTELINRLIELALERFAREQQLKTRVDL